MAVFAQLTVDFTKGLSWNTDSSPKAIFVTKV